MIDSLGSLVINRKDREVIDLELKELSLIVFNSSKRTRELGLNA